MEVFEVSDNPLLMVPAHYGWLQTFLVKIALNPKWGNTTQTEFIPMKRLVTNQSGQALHSEMVWALT